MGSDIQTDITASFIVIELKTGQISIQIYLF